MTNSEQLTLHMCLQIILLVGTSQNLLSFLKQVPQISSTFNLIKCIGRESYGIVMLGEMKSVLDVKFPLKYLLPTACVKAPSENQRFASDW